MTWKHIDCSMRPERHTKPPGISTPTIRPMRSMPGDVIKSNSTRSSSGGGSRRRNMVLCYGCGTAEKSFCFRGRGRKESPRWQTFRADLPPKRRGRCSNFSSGQRFCIPARGSSRASCPIRMNHHPRTRNCSNGCSPFGRCPVLPSRPYRRRILLNNFP